MTRAIEYLGRPIGELLEVHPFSQWQAVRTIENEPTPEVWYEFEGHGVEVICDEMDRVSTVFVHRGGDGEGLVDISFAATRGEVLRRLGSPEKSGAAVRIPGVGEQGPWDRFTLLEGTLHVQYAASGVEIDMITLMRADVVP